MDPTIPRSVLLSRQPGVAEREGSLVTILRNFYDLQGDPFAPTSHPAWLFASRGHMAAVQTLRESLKAGQALAILLGEPGVGKTFLVHVALAHPDLQHLKTVHLWYPTCSFHDTLQMLGWELGLEAVHDDTAMLAHALHRALLTEHESGRQVVLVIDEAHTIPVEEVESLLRLSHVRALTGAPLLQMVLVGLPALWRHGAAPPWRSCKHHTVTRVTLAPLTYSESLAYIRHRLLQAGAGEDTVFTPEAVRYIARHARGNPRVINVLCTHMLLTGFSARQKPITVHIAHDVVKAYPATSSPPHWWRGMLVTASTLAVVGLVAMFSSTSQITPSLLAGTGVETAQYPAEMVVSPAVSTLSTLPVPTDAASPPAAPMQSPVPSGQITALPEPPAYQMPPPPSPVTARILQVAQTPELPLEPATSRLLPTHSEQPVTPQARRAEARPSKTAPGLSAISTTPATTTHITFPQHGAIVARKIAVEGVIVGLEPDQHVFLCVQSQAFGRRIYPQGKVRPDPTGKWTVESIYGSSGYQYETYLVSTTSPDAAARLSAQLSRKYGLHDLPPGTERLGTVIVVRRE